MPAPRRLILIIVVILSLLLLIVVPGVSWAQAPPSSWQDPARQLAKKIVAITGLRQSVSLALRNMSALSDSEVAAVRAALEAELRAAGVRLATKPSSAQELRVTLSENVQGLLWVAEVLRDNAREVAMISILKDSVSTAAITTQMFDLNSKLIFEQEERILDFTIVESEKADTIPTLLVLDPTRLAIYQSGNNRWSLRQSALLPAPLPASRDLRGNFMVLDDRIEVFLPGMVCTGTIRPELNLRCSASDQGRPDVSQKPGDPASIPTPVTITGWGTEMVRIITACGHGSQLLATRPGDWTEQDAVQAFEIQGSQAIAVSSSLSLPGPAVELIPGVASKSAGAIVRNLKTGHYEAHTLTLSCGR